MKFEARTVVFSETINEKGGFYSSMYIYKLILESGLYMIHIRRSNLDVRFLNSRDEDEMQDDFEHLM